MKAAVEHGVMKVGPVVVRVACEHASIAKLLHDGVITKCMSRRKERTMSEDGEAESEPTEAEKDVHQIRK